MTKLAEFIQAVALVQQKTVSGGLIIFLQSYGYQKQFRDFVNMQVEEETARDNSRWLLRCPKSVFWETQNDSSAFARYSERIQKEKAFAMLVCVIGGKLSEGINFSDELARTVLVCGLPYPSTQSTSMREKMVFYDLRGPDSFKGRDYYENLCMRTLNQAVGRALRHANDFATILLLDARFNTSEQIRSKLPVWLKRKLVKDVGVEHVVTMVEQFFLAKISH